MTLMTSSVRSRNYFNELYLHFSQKKSDSKFRIRLNRHPSQNLPPYNPHAHNNSPCAPPLSWEPWIDLPSPSSHKATTSAPSPISFTQNPLPDPLPPPPTATRPPPNT